MAIDPICGMTVEPATAAGRFDHDGETYYFCSTRCLDRFRAAPNQYVKTASLVGAAVPTAGRRPLPMMQPMPAQDPSAGGERDPVCGMTVQPATAAGPTPTNRKPTTSAALVVSTNSGPIRPGIYRLPPPRQRKRRVSSEERPFPCWRRRRPVRRLSA